MTENLYHNGQKLEAPQIELYSEEVQEIMGTIPPWIIRRGMVVMLVLVFGLLALSALVHYPDMISARITLTTTSPPIRIFARANGKITQLLVENQAIVSEGTYLAVIENAANTASVFALEKLLNKGLADHTKITEWPAFDDLGELQGAYSAFIHARENGHFYAQSSTFRGAQQVLLSEQAEELRAMNQNLEEQRTLLQRETAIAKAQFRASETLYAEGAISKVELETKEATLLQKELAAKQLHSSIFQNNIQISEYQKKIQEIRQENLHSGFSFDLNISDAFQQLSAGIENWKQNYLIVAPQKGRVEYLDIWAENQYVKTGAEVISIVPDSEEVLGKAIVSSLNAGKIQTGQKVNIKLDNYDYREFGMLSGEIRNISSLAKDGQYILDIQLSNGLLTTYKKTIRFQSEMYGQAEVITQDISLLDRIFFQFRELLTPTVVNG
ncbi:MAG: HlyD family efflux transporter periplasmic adaptor subunit [Bacteroidia bacterium]|nr:HlyD family efflux transporter periplasmic adaptor subunit [Bacteroidia bacterium]